MIEIKTRKKLSANGLINTVRKVFDTITDYRKPNLITFSLSDVLMSAFAMFSLKYPSLLAFNNDKDKNSNLESIYGIKKVPSDTQMRTIIDEIKPDKIAPLFKQIFHDLQRGKALEAFIFMDNRYILSLDGTGYYSSDTICCESCLEKNIKKPTQPLTLTKCSVLSSFTLTSMSLSQLHQSLLSNKMVLLKTIANEMLLNASYKTLEPNILTYQ
jgi:hypothetical protein